MITIKKFEDKYLEELKEIDFMMWLCLQWNSTFLRENAVAAVDEKDTLLGVCALSCDGTWYYIEKERQDIPLYRMQMEICVKDGIAEQELVERQLIQAVKQRLQQIKEKYPDKKLCIRCWCKESEYDKQQQLLELGFTGNNITWIMGFDLEHTEIPDAVIPEEIAVELLDGTEEELRAYLTANELGYNKVQDAEGELRFRLGDERTKLFAAWDGERVVSSVTVWHISDDRAATENIFTIPEYRRKKIGTKTIGKALTYLKEQGYKLATLTCVGDNGDAIALYTQIGYKVVGHLLEMHWEI